MRRAAIRASILFALLATQADAVEYAGIELSFNGFGTLGVVHSDYDEADFVSDVYFHVDGAGHARKWSAEQDTKLGLQLTATLGSRLTAVVQAVSQLRYDNTFKPELEWANLTFAVRPEVTLRIGRILLPTFMSSDTQLVGYVRPWVRTPAEMLVMQPLTSSDGVDATWLFNVGKATHRLQVLFGENTSKLPGGLPYENRAIRNITETIEYGSLTTHLSYQKLRYTYATDPETDYAQFDIGMGWDTGRWFVSAELLLSNDELVGNTRSWHAGGGYRIGDFTPFLNHARIKQTSMEPYFGVEFYNQHTSTVGLRWDFRKNLAAKVQLQRIELDNLAFPASFINLQPGAQIGDVANVLSATLDFVW